MITAKAAAATRAGSRTLRALVFGSALALVTASAQLAAQGEAPRVIVPGAADRLELPIVAPTPQSITTVDASKAVAPPRFQVQAPRGAPNVVLIMLDDFGFGQSSTFGGPIAMPNVARLAARGLRYNRFHTSAICSATRAALLTGHNPHQVNMGSLPDVATSFPGNTGEMPLSAAPLADILRLNGYATAMFGKSHEAPPWERTPNGPYRQWPTGMGFEKFYGFMGGETDQYAPAIFDGTRPVDTPRSLGYHFTVDMTDHAIDWLGSVHSLTPDKPFFMYFATGATHAPHQVPKQWIDKYKGKFAMGWDKLREQTLERQIAMGIAPPGTKLTPRPKEIPAWDSMDAQQKKFLEREMETYAGFADHTDAQIGRLVDALEANGQIDNTLIVFVLGDNGASAEGGPLGTDNEKRGLNGIIATTDQMVDKVDQWGSPTTYPHYAVGWAWAGNAPFQWTKQIASHFGGTRNGLIIDWPGHTAHGEVVRNQFHHVIDIAPTILEAAGIPLPRKVNGVTQDPMEGVSMAYTFMDPKARDRRTTQYFEMFGNRAIYHDGWIAAAKHALPWVLGPVPPFEQDRWELYNIDQDFSEANDLATAMPGKLKEMQDLFTAEAVRNHVFPIDVRRAERLDPAIAGRPNIPNGRRSMTLLPGMRRLHETASINTVGAHFSVTAEIEITGKNGEGVIIAQGSHSAGWTMFMRRNRVYYEYNLFNDERTKLASPMLKAGRHVIVYEFTPDTEKRGSGGLAVLRIDGQEVQRVQIPKTVPFAWIAEDGLDVGLDDGSAVSYDYAVGDNAFKGKIFGVRIDLL